MKLKIAAISTILFLTGCANIPPGGPIINADELGVIRTAADRTAYDGNVKFVPGSGITYTRATNQCGRNCGSHAVLAAKLDAEKAAREAAYEEQYQANLKEYSRQSRQSEIIKKCEMRVTMFTAKRQDDYRESVMTNGYNSKVTRVYAQELNTAKQNFFKNIDRCVEVMSK